MSHQPLPPGATIGIVGGGQLGRMLALDAARLGFRVHVYCPDGGSPAFAVSAAHVQAAYEDEDALARFARDVDVVTYEFENVPSRTAEVLASHRPLFPGARALQVAQDRLEEKNFLRQLGLPLADFAAVDGRGDLSAAVQRLGRPSVLKTRRFGYDGKGQITLRDDVLLENALDAVNRQPSVLEAFVPFVREISVVAARGQDGAFAAYDVTENRHANHILNTSTVPANLSSEACVEAQAMARSIADALGYVGVIGVEMFVVEDGGRERLLINEIAPRVHNSGHWTQDGAETSQFEQHIRAVAGWPLGSTQRLARTQMTNLIGDDVSAWSSLAAEPGARLHLYGKAEARPGRKMGHVNRLLPGN
ncbi:5-(carboxyamino)imidazole ribonucleotide synthase [Terrihabitans rhizophilus]|uniref:N5-carboxyaminoimidazole ribonucleotide synthase n=1 Tax=Terrihabitans rhizophilus TaxID=3092662 RepID=A0ABU4RPB9_9HYPH|nr:5-(carboxyamino)imidazole ribonucleotide synthase [Terrihabitans sp. PJ23]MDX6806689.1 5-(carboxyamino)imidazole ribonucleotide synthase [Terrihabitans sp. PJ23]